MRIRPFIPRFLSNSRGVAATEFALIAPALIFLIMGVFEMSFRFRASEEATRYVDFDRLAISPQCGFASTVAGNPLTEADVRAKLALVVQAAKSIWG